MARIAIIFPLVLCLAACNSGFSDADIENCKASIREEFGKRGGGEVTDVQMMRESSTKLVGFLKVKVPILGEFTKPCSATMGEGHQYLWTCQ